MAAFGLKNDGDISKPVKTDYGFHIIKRISKKSQPTFEEAKGDKQPVGKHLREISYTEHQISITSGDTIYMCTDGYADQFGGAFGKKLKAAQLKLKLSEIHQQPMEEQKHALLHVFDTWKGSHEQVDDVCIVGIRF